MAMLINQMVGSQSTSSQGTSACGHGARAPRREMAARLAEETQVEAEAVPGRWFWLGG